MGFLDFLKLNNSPSAAIEPSSTTAANSAAQEDISVFVNENSNTSNLVIEEDKEDKFDINALTNIESDAIITFEDGSTISLDDYTDYLLNQQVGFETQEEYQNYIVDKLNSYLNEMKATYQAQEDSDGWLSNLYDGAKELFNLGVSSKDVEDNISKYEEMLQGLKDAANGKSDMTFEQAYEYYTGTSFSSEKIDEYMENANIYSALMVGCQYDEDYMEKFEKATGVSVNDVMSAYAQCQLDTFGEASEVKNIIDEYSKDQQTYSDKLSSIISTAGTGLMVAGGLAMFVNPAVGIAIMKAGNTVALSGMFINNAIDLVDDATDSDGLTKEELGDIALETGVEIATHKAGRIIGGFTNGLNGTVSQKVAQAGANKVVTHIAGQATETVVDTALSLGADYVIAQGESLIETGEFIDSQDFWTLDRFLNEGRSQLIGILTGLSSAKIDAYQKNVITTAQKMVLDGDTDGAKSYLKQSGMKMDDTSFEGFVKNVQDVDIMMKSQAAQAEDALDGVEVDTKVTAELDVEAEKGVEVDGVETQKSIEANDGEEVTDGLAGKIGIQFFAQKTTEGDVDYSKLTYEEKVDLFKNAGINERHIEGLATNLEGEQIGNAIALKNAGVADHYIKDFATNLEGTQIDNAIILKNAGVADYRIKGLATLDDKQFKRALEFKDIGINYDNLLSFATLNDKQCERALILLDTDAEQEFIPYLTRLNDKDFNNLIKYLDMGIDGEKAKSLVRSGIDIFPQMDLVEVPQEAKTNMFKNFFANNSSADEVIKNTDFSQFGKDGIPLEYSRSQFLADLSAELTKLPTEAQTEIVKKLGIDIIQDESGNITGYDGIIDLTKLSTDSIEGNVLELANNFILNNKVVTGDSEVDNALNSLIQGMPEFVNTIGKQQHGTHSYSLDTHILETYKAAISDSDYENLSNYQKFELKLMTILHDISKNEGVVDDNHPLVSAKYAKDILSRYSLADSTKYNVVNNILNHHWGKDYNTEAVSTETTAVQMGTVSNYDIQKIFAKADLLGMGNSEFSADKLDGLSDSSQERLVTTLGKTKETTPLVYTSALIKPDLIPSQEVSLPDGTTKTIKSFNLAELPDDYDMEEFGFIPGTKASDVTLGVHTANSTSQFNLFKILTSDPVASSPQSVSIVSKDNNALFKRFGIAINLKAADVINATHYDQGCGTTKTNNQLIKLTTGDWDYENWREIIPNKIQEKLGITQSEYSELASIIEDYKWLTQIKDSKEITIGDKTFSGSEIKTAISTAQAELMQMATYKAPANDGAHIEGNITELTVRRAEVIDDTYILRYNSVDDMNNENIPSDERIALSKFLADIPQNSTVIFVGYDGYLYSSHANQWNERKKPTTDVKE